MTSSNEYRCRRRTKSGARTRQRRGAASNVSRVDLRICCEVSNVIEERGGDSSIEFAFLVDLVQQTRLELRERENGAQRVDSLGSRSDEALELYDASRPVRAAYRGVAVRFVAQE